MAEYERTKFFGIRLDPVTDAADAEAPLWARFSGFSPLADTRVEAVQAIKKIGNAGETWLIAQTIAMYEFDEPQPPVRLKKEYR